MKTEKNILVAFLLNLSFSIFEFIGGILTGSVAIISDALHDVGDAAGIGLSFFLEKKSKKAPDERYTYGYSRYSVIGGFITTLILLISSLVVISGAIERIISPVNINYDGMIIFAIVGVSVNFCAAYFTRDGESINQRAVNLHMLEDVLGWALVLVGAIVMRFTDFALLDPIISIGVSLFILINAVKNLAEIKDLFLGKAPEGITPEVIRKHLTELDGVSDVHHIHVWSLDGINNYATLHAVSSSDMEQVKRAIKAELKELGITHATVETEEEGEDCHEKECHVHFTPSHTHHHHHHGHHHHDSTHNHHEDEHSHHKTHENDKSHHGHDHSDNTH